MASQYKQSSLHREPVELRVEVLLTQNNISQQKMRRLFPRHNSHSFNALLLFMKNKRPDLVRKLLSLHPTLLKPELLCMVLETGFDDLEVIQKIPISQKTAHKCLPYGIKTNNPSIVKYLLEEGNIRLVDPDLIDDYLFEHFNKDSFNTNIFDLLVDRRPSVRHNVFVACFFIKDEKKQCHCIKRVLEKSPNWIHEVLNHVIGSVWHSKFTNDTQGYENRIISAFRCMDNIQFTINYKEMLKHMLRSLMSYTWLRTYPYVVKIVEYSLKHINNNDTEHLSDYLNYAIETKNKDLLGKLHSKFGKKIFQSKFRGGNNVIRFVHDRPDAYWAIPILFSYIGNYKEKMTRLEEELAYSKNICSSSRKTPAYLEYRKILKELYKQLVSQGQLLSGMSALRSAVSGKNIGSLRQHPAKSMVQSRYRNLQQISKTYGSKKSLKRPMQSTYQKVRKQNPANPFVQKGSKRLKIQQIQNLQKYKDLLSGMSGLDQGSYRQLLKYLGKQQQQQQQQKQT